MARVDYNKLIRDRIPNILIAKGIDFKARICEDDEEYKFTLVEKLQEEAYETKQALLSYLENLDNDKAAKEAYLQEVVKELADTESIIIELLKVFNISRDTLNTEINKKNKENGGFDDKIILEWADDPEHKLPPDAYDPVNPTVEECH